MLYLEELVDAVIAEEGQTLLGLDFLIDALELPMKKIDLIFKKVLGEHSERRPMKVTKVINSFDYTLKDDEGNEVGYVKLPEGTTSCRIARYGVLPNQMPRFYMPKFSEQNVEFDPYTLFCRVWPPVAPLRLTYTQKYVPTTNILLEKTISIPYETNEVSFDLETAFAGNTLFIQKQVLRYDEEGKQVSEMLTMSPTGEILESEDGFSGDLIRKAELSGSLGEGYVDLKTREVSLNLVDDSKAPIMVSYYPKYSCVKELDLGDRIFTKRFASRFIRAIAALKMQANQEKLHNIDISQEELLTRAAKLEEEVRTICKNTISFASLSPM